MPILCYLPCQEKAVKSTHDKEGGTNIPIPPTSSTHLLFLKSCCPFLSQGNVYIYSELSKPHRPTELPYWSRVPVKMPLCQKSVVGTIKVEWSHGNLPACHPSSREIPQVTPNSVLLHSACKSQNDPCQNDHLPRWSLKRSSQCHCCRSSNLECFELPPLPPQGSGPKAQAGLCRWNWRGDKISFTGSGHTLGLHD